jgi:hypothetical protein
MLAMLSRRCPTNWDTYLPLTVHAYNTSYHASISEIPFYLMFGRDPEPLIYANEDAGKEVPTSVKSRLEKLKVARRVVAKLLLSEQKRVKGTYDKNARPKTVSVGDVVLLQSILPQNAPVRKLFPRYVGPYRVAAVTGHVLSVVPVQMPNATPKKIHIDRAKACTNTCMLNSTLPELLSPFHDVYSADPHLEAESAE